MQLIVEIFQGFKDSIQTMPFTEMAKEGDFISIFAIMKTAWFWSITFLLCIAMYALRDLFCETTPLLDPRSTTNEKVLVKTIQPVRMYRSKGEWKTIPWKTIDKFARMLIAAIFILIERGAREQSIWIRGSVDWNGVSEVIFTFLFMIVFYTLGGNDAVEWLINKCRTALGMDKYRGAISEEEYKLLGVPLSEKKS